MNTILEEIERLTKKLGDEHHLSGYVDAMTDGFFDWKMKENYEYFSPKFWITLGYDPSEKTTSPHEWEKLISPKDLEGCKDLLFKHIESKGEVEFKTEMDYIHKSGKIVRILCRGKVIEWEGIEPVRMIGTHINISKYVQ